MTDKQKDIAELERLLGELDITNPEAARVLGITVQTIYRWFRGDAPIPLMALRLLRLMLHVQGTEKMIRVYWAEPEETVDAAHG